ncbi:MAG: two-component regulator propeller domain-containing protein [Bacteroidota bacterium]
MKRCSAFCSFLFFALSIVPLTAQSILDTLSFQHIKTGMVQSSVSQIYEDSHGFLWIGTPSGLNRYDGTEFQVFEKSMDGVLGLTDGYVESIYEDIEGSLYIGTNQGLNIYDRKINVVKPYPFLAEGQILRTKYIGAIARSNDFLWLGTDNGGLYRYHIKTGETKQIRFNQIYSDGPSNHYIVEVFPINGNNVLFMTQASVYIINADLQVISQIDQPQNISSVFQISETEYLLGSHNGELVELKVQDNLGLMTKTIPINPGHSILALAQDTHGNIWLGTENAGLSIYSTKTGSIDNLQVQASKPHSISSNSIWSILKAKNGVIWLGPYKNGLSFYDPEYYKFKHYKTDPFNPSSLSNNIVNTFAKADNDNLWIGTDGGGLNYWNRNENTFEVYSLNNGKLHTDVVLSLLNDDQQQLWIGSWAKGLAIMDLNTKNIRLWNKENSFLGSNNVTDMLQDRKGRIWIVTLFGGVHIYYPENGTYEHVSIRSERDGSKIITVARLLEDDKGHIWVGSQTSGLFRLVENNDKWVPVHYHTFHEKRAISNDFINTIVQDNEGTIWVGTQAGLNKYQPETDSFLAITKKEGLVNDAIKGIISDNEGYLWLSTGNGIIRYHSQKGEPIHYGVDDGLQGYEFNAASCYSTNKGELIFGGSNGFNIFTPSAVKKRNDVPEVFISGLQIFNQRVLPNDKFGVLTSDISQTDTLTLSYDHDVVNFEFHALTYRHPEQVHFAYYLDGFETQWNYVGDDKHATYTNLNPGNYTLRIKSTNSDGVWVDNETALFLRIEPPFWKTWWFITLLIAATALGIYLLYYVRVRRLKRYQTKLEQEIDERTSELQLKHKKLIAAADELTVKNEEIQRFAFAVSHDLKSPLNSIKAIASLIPMEMDLAKFPDLLEYVKYIDETTDLMNDLITDITKIAKLGKIENNNEWLNTNEVVELARNMVHGRLNERNAKLYVDKNLPKILGDKNRMVQVFENLLDNAIKYMGSQKNPMVRVESRATEDQNQFLVIDNGSGMDKATLEKLFTPFERFDGSVEGSGLGLYMVKKIIEAHRGTIKAVSEGKDKGTIFIVSLPIVNLTV